MNDRERAAEPLVSLVTTSYGHEMFIVDYIRGILDQEYENLEILFVDDGSPDRTTDIIGAYREELERRFARVSIERTENLGGKEQLARLCNRARGKYVAFCESDDRWLPGRLRKSVDALEVSVGAVLAYGNVEYMDETGAALSRADGGVACNRGPDADPFMALLRFNWIKTPTVTIRAEALARCVDFREYRRRGYLLGDLPAWLDLGRAGSFVGIAERLAKYRVHAGSGSRPREALGHYRFVDSVRHVRADYARRYNVAGDVLRDIELRRCMFRYHRALQVGQREDFWDAVNFMLAHYPDALGPMCRAAMRLLRTTALSRRCASPLLWLDRRWRAR